MVASVRLLVAVMAVPVAMDCSCSAPVDELIDARMPRAALALIAFIRPVVVEEPLAMSTVVALLTPPELFRLKVTAVPLPFCRTRLPPSASVPAVDIPAPVLIETDPGVARVGPVPAVNAEVPTVVYAFVRVLRPTVIVPVPLGAVEVTVNPAEVAVALKSRPALEMAKARAPNV